MLSNASLLFLGGGGGKVSGLETVLLNNPATFIVYRSIHVCVCLSYLFHKTLKLPIINAKPIAIIKNHKRNETIY